MCDAVEDAEGLSHVGVVEGRVSQGSWGLGVEVCVAVAVV